MGVHGGDADAGSAAARAALGADPLPSPAAAASKDVEQRVLVLRDESHLRPQLLEQTLKFRWLLQSVGGFLDAGQVREHSSMELCGPHVTISPAMLRYSNISGREAGAGLRGHESEHRKLDARAAPQRRQRGGNVRVLLLLRLLLLFLLLLLLLLLTDCTLAPSHAGTATTTRYMHIRISAVDSLSHSLLLTGHARRPRPALAR